MSAIDPTKPVSGSPTTASVRANFAAAKSEIEALVSATSDIQGQLDSKLDAGDFTAPNNPIITLTAGAGLTGGGSFTLNQAGNATVTFNSSGAVGNHYQEFLSSGTWTKPDGATWVYVECIGGGGGGANRTDIETCSGGGGGLGLSRLLRASDLGLTVTVTVGAGGAGANNGVTGDGSAGGSSSFGSRVIALGGTGGGDTANLFVLPPGSAYPFASILGQYSGAPHQFGGGSDPYGAGANSIFGGGGGGSANAGTGGSSTYAGAGGAGVATASTKGVDGSQPGGGGGASRNDGGGGNGGNGRVRVWAW